MPVSKKRKKDGKVVQRKDAGGQPTDEHGAPVEARPAHGPQRAGKPANPFVSQQQAKRGAQRGH